MRARALFALALLVTTRSALADDVSVAAETFRAGSASYARKDYRAAALSFELSNRLAPHALALYSAGLAWQAAGENARAATDYDAAARDERLPDAQRKDTAARLEQLKPSLGRLRVAAPADATVSVAYVDGQRAPVFCYLVPGNHEVRVAFASGQTETKSVEVSAGAEASLDIEAPPTAPVEATPAPAAPAPAPASAVQPKPDAAQSPGGARRTLGWISVGVGAAGVGAGVALGAAALGARDDFVESGRFDAGARDRAATLRTLANVGLFAGGALAIAGVVLIATAPRAPATALVVGPQGASVHGRF